MGKVINLLNSDQPKHERDTFYTTMLASVEVAHHKGNDVLVQAINKVDRYNRYQSIIAQFTKKVCSMYQQKEEILIPQTVLITRILLSKYILIGLFKDSDGGQLPRNSSD